MNGADTPESFNVLAVGRVYEIHVETVMDDPDWLDKVLLEVTRDEPRSLQELFDVLRPLPHRLVENALARLLEQNVLLLDVYDGSVRTSPLNAKPVTRRRDTFHVWQDHATGTIVLRDQIRSVEKKTSRSGEDARPPLRLAGGPPRRTPLIMSNAELLHHLGRAHNRLDPRAEIREAKGGKEPIPLSIRTILREDGRYAFLDAVPWRLRAAWARVSSLQTVADDLKRELPAPWDVLVGRWADDAHSRISKQPRHRETAFSSSILQILDAKVSIELAAGGTAVTKEIAGRAKSSAVVAVFGGHGTPSDAVQILMEAPTDERILVVGTSPSEEKIHQWEKDHIRVVRTGQHEGPDFVLIDGVRLALGGIRANSGRVIRVSAQSPLEGVVSWLETIDVAIPRRQRTSHSAITADMQNFEHDLSELVGEFSARSQKRRKPEDESAAVRVRQALTERCDSITARLQREVPLPFLWFSAAEVLSLVEEWSGSLRVIARTDASPLYSAAFRRNAECAIWPPAEVSADCVILDSVVIVGFAPVDPRESMPEFLAIADVDFARELRTKTS
jgi:hypothetical protein